MIMGSEKLYVKDLKIGGIYYYQIKVNGVLHTTFYCYLGRNTRNEFLWLYLRDPADFKRNNVPYMCISCIEGSNIVDTTNTKDFTYLQRPLGNAWDCLIGFIAPVTRIMGYLTLWYKYKLPHAYIGVDEDYGLAIDFTRIAGVKLLKRSDEYLGGIDAGVQERKDNTTEVWRERYITAYECVYDESIQNYTHKRRKDGMLYINDYVGERPTCGTIEMQAAMQEIDAWLDKTMRYCNDYDVIVCVNVDTQYSIDPRNLKELLVHATRSPKLSHKLSKLWFE